MHVTTARSSAHADLPKPNQTPRHALAEDTTILQTVRGGWGWGLCGCMLSRFSTVWLLPFTLLSLQAVRL